MKKILTILAVAILASATVFAITFDGTFKGGYKFTFSEDDAYEAVGWKQNVEARLNVKIADDNGIWTIKLKDMAALDSDDKIKANLSLDIDNLIKANGGDLGDFNIGLSIGANSAMTALSAYNDVSGDELFKAKNNGTYSAELALGYGKMIETKVAFDPAANTITDGVEAKNTGKASVVVSAMTTPVDGVSASLAYAYNGLMYDTDKDYKIFADHVVNAAVNANIGTLANLDFDLGVTVFDSFGSGNITKDDDNKAGTEPITYGDGGKTYNVLNAAVYGGVDLVNAFFEFRMFNGADTSCGMKTQVNVNPVENLALDVYFNMADFSDVNEIKVGGDVSYTISGVEFAANLEYAVDGSAFSVTPKVIVVF